MRTISLLFSIFFAAVLLVAIQRFNENSTVETAIEYVRCVVWGCCLPQGLERMMVALVDVFGEFGRL